MIRLTHEVTEETIVEAIEKGELDLIKILAWLHQAGQRRALPRSNFLNMEDYSNAIGMLAIMQVSCEAGLRGEPSEEMARINFMGALND